MEKIAKGQETELYVDKLAFGGMAVARVDGFVFFLDRAVPGQIVRARITKKKKNYAEARVLEVVSESPHQVKAPCPHFGICGGCHWQDISYPVQLHWKKSHVLESLGHIAGIGEAEVLPIIASPEPFRYRNKMEFTFSARRWLSPEEFSREEPPPAESLFALGLHVRGLFDKVFTIDSCCLQSETANAILRDVRDWARNSGLPAYTIRSHEGFWRFLVIREARRTGEMLVHLITSGTPKADSAVEDLGARLGSLYPQITTLVHSISDKKSQVAAGDSSRVLFGTGRIEERLGDLRFRISSHSFFQTNSLGAEMLYDTVAELGEFDGSEKVWDLYCGTGSIGIYIASRVKEVFGIELIEDAVEDARENCRINSIRNCSFLAGDLKDVIREASQEGRPDVVITDPPRAGMHPKVVKTLLEVAPRKIIAVSCNPASLARDAALLTEAYEIGAVQPFDLFPHTPHLECVVRFDRKE
ncbi:MAG: 23S rRNA (uracil(1939)-C(5))-methyltransferase RlmD [Desulfobacteraceae bacterium]|nr:23S rRNA (uracil(1939)-C(5))-methyltransferase RlmD [Desulfobacteraceae bacterium]